MRGPPIDAFARVGVVLIWRGQIAAVEAAIGTPERKGGAKPGYESQIQVWEAFSAKRGSAEAKTQHCHFGSIFGACFEQPD
jgi:hypothetical protein